MTEVTFLKSETGLRGFQVKDHTGYAIQGQDIVCAAISALTQTAVLGLDNVAGIKPQVELDDGYLFCVIPQGLPAEKWERAQIIFKVLMAGITAITEKYGKYVRMKEVRYGENRNESSAVRDQKRRGKH